MAYQAKRAKNQTEIFELINDDGEVVNHFEVRIDAGGFGKRLSEKYVELSRALAACQQIQTKTIDPSDVDRVMETVGLAVTDILYSVFGEADARKIIQFYDKNYVEMCQEVMPFVTETVLPKARKLGQANRKQAIQSYTKG